MKRDKRDQTQTKEGANETIAKQKSNQMKDDSEKRRRKKRQRKRTKQFEQINEEIKM